LVGWIKKILGIIDDWAHREGDAAAVHDWQGDKGKREKNVVGRNCGPDATLRASRVRGENPPLALPVVNVV